MTSGPTLQKRSSKELAEFLHGLTAHLEAKYSQEELLELRDQIPDDPDAAYKFLLGAAQRHFAKVPDNVVAFPVLATPTEQEPPPEPQSHPTEARGIAVLRTVALALCIAALLQAPAYAGTLPDIFWLVGTMAGAAACTWRRLPLASSAFALMGAAFGESVLRVAGVGLPHLSMTHVAAAFAWVILLRLGDLDVRGRIAARAGLGVGCGFVIASWAGVDLGAAWVVPFAVATAILTQRAFAKDRFREARISIAAAGLVPLAVSMTISLFYDVPGYGSLYITSMNIWASVAPLGCIVYAAATSLARLRRELTS